MFKPLGNLLTVVQDPPSKKTPGGLVMPDNFGEVFITGVVRAVGPGHYDGGVLIEVRPQPGDRVMIAQHTDPRNGRVMPYPTIIDDGTKCLILNESEVLGIVPGDFPLVQA
jgi:co-chaperonin GroES (HSP10)